MSSLAPTTTTTTTTTAETAGLADLSRLLDQLDSELASLFALCRAELDALPSTSAAAVAGRERVQVLFDKIVAVASDYSLGDAPPLSDAAPLDFARMALEAKTRAELPWNQITRTRRQVQMAQRVLTLASGAPPPPPLQPTTAASAVSVSSMASAASLSSLY